MYKKAPSLCINQVDQGAATLYHSSVTRRCCLITLSAARRWYLVTIIAPWRLVTLSSQGALLHFSDTGRQCSVTLSAIICQCLVTLSAKGAGGLARVLKNIQLFTQS